MRIDAASVGVRRRRRGGPASVGAGGGALRQRVEASGVAWRARGAVGRGAVQRR